MLARRPLPVQPQAMVFERSWLFWESKPEARVVGDMPPPSRAAFVSAHLEDQVIAPRFWARLKVLVS